MSSMLEQAILDAKELKEAAIKNAQQALIEKYSNEFEGEVEKLLEQAAVPPTDPMAAAALAVPTPTTGMPVTPASAPVDAERAKSDSDSKSDIFSKLEYAYKDGEVIGNKVYTNGLVEIDLDSLSEFSFEQNKKDAEQMALQELKALSRKSKLNEELDEEMNDDDGFDDDSDSFPYDDEDEDMDDEDMDDEDEDEEDDEDYDDLDDKDIDLDDENIDDEDLDMDDEDFEDEDMESDADELDDLHDFNDEEDMEDIDDLDSLDIDDEEVDDFDIEDEEFSDDEDVEDEDLYMSDEDPNRFEIDYETDQDDADYNPDADVEDDEEDSEEDEDESDEEEYYDEEDDEEEELEETKKSSKVKHLAKKGVALAAAASTMIGSKDQENIQKSKKAKTEKHVVSEEESENTSNEKAVEIVEDLIGQIENALNILDSNKHPGLAQRLKRMLKTAKGKKEELQEAIKLDYQRSGPRSPWNGMFREEGEHDVMLAELQSQIAELEQEVEELQESNKKLKNGLKESLKINESLNDKVAKFEQKLLESRFLNYKLLYTNKALTDASLNERQKNKIAESISNARTAEEVKLLYETLKSTMRDGTSSSSPKSLSEAVERRSSSLLLRASRAEAPKQNDYAERMKKLAGLA